VIAFGESTPMNMKDHILAAMREQVERWQELLATLSEEQTTAPNFHLDWSIKDVVAHLWAWQQISIARLQAGVLDREPELPKWFDELGNLWEEDADQTNAWFYEKNHLKPWSEVYGHWKQGYLRLLELGAQISERDLLDGDRYAWLRGYSLAAILIASYDHHQEHYEKLIAFLAAS
jgi:hypothetical protein